MIPVFQTKYHWLPSELVIYEENCKKTNSYKGKMGDTVFLWLKAKKTQKNWKKCDFYEIIY